MDKAGPRFKEAKIDDPAKHFAGKTIRVTGEVSTFREQAELIVTDPEQIKVVE